MAPTADALDYNPYLPISKIFRWLAICDDSIGSTPPPHPASHPPPLRPHASRAASGRCLLLGEPSDGAGIAALAAAAGGALQTLHSLPAAEGAAPPGDEPPGGAAAAELVRTAKLQKRFQKERKTVQPLLDPASTTWSQNASKSDYSFPEDVVKFEGALVDRQSLRCEFNFSHMRKGFQHFISYALLHQGRANHGDVIYLA